MDLEVVENKKCTKCKILKNITCFYIKGITKKGLNKLSSRCKVCLKILTSKEYYKNPKKYLKRNKKARDKRKKLTPKKYRLQEKNRALKTLYGIGLKDYNFLKKKQNSKCAICIKNKKLFVDHCHKTGKVRGLLCHKCNSGLGMFNDNVNLCKNAGKYLNETWKQKTTRRTCQRKTGRL